MIKIVKQISILILLIFILLIPYFVFAGEPTTESVLEGIGKSSGYQTIGVNQFTMAEIAGTAVKVFLSILGIIFIGLMLYGGYMWMMDRGSSESIEKAKETIKTAIIGLVIVIGAYAISYFIFSRITQDVLTDPKGGGGSGSEIECDYPYKKVGDKCELIQGS